MSSNLLKSRWVVVDTEEKRIINSDEHLAERMERWNNSVPNSYEEYAEYEEEFTDGLAAEQVEGLLSEDAEESVIKARNARDEEQREELLKQAQNEVEMAKIQAAKIIEDARGDIEVMRRVAAEEARGQGYTEGFDRGVAEIEKMRANLQEDRRKLQMEYDQRVDELEPQFIDLITAVYEQVLGVELKSYGEIVSHLVANTMRNSGESKDFIVHVSKADYEYVSGQKEEIRVNAAAGMATLEIIEDITLSPGECMIETGGGVFDCGLGTQLAGLNQKLKLLSFEK